MSGDVGKGYIIARWVKEGLVRDACPRHREEVREMWFWAELLWHSI